MKREDAEKLVKSYGNAMGGLIELHTHEVQRQWIEHGGWDKIPAVAQLREAEAKLLNALTDQEPIAGMPSDEEVDELCRMFWEEYRSSDGFSSGWDHVRASHKDDIRRGIIAVAERLSRE